MAVLSLGKAAKSLTATRKKTSLASKTIKNVSNILTNRAITRKNLSSNILNYKNRRAQYEKRQQLQDAVYAPLKVTQFRGPTTLALSSVGKNFTDRILGFVGFVSAGWLLSNMPTWIAGGEQLIKRIRSINYIISDFSDSVGEMMRDIGGIANAFYQNISIFDFSDSSYRLRSSVDDLSLTLRMMGDQITEAFEVLTEPFTNIPPLGSKGKPGAYPDLTPPSQQQPSPPVSGGNSDFWTLVAIASREDSDPQGQADVAQSIYNRAASGAYGSKSIKSLILRYEQYQPTWERPKKGKYGQPNKEWYNITDAESAAKATGLSPDTIKGVAKNITNQTLQKNAAKFVGGRTDFKGYDVPGSIRRKPGDNWFGWEYGYKGKSVAEVPDFGVSGQPTAKLSPSQVLSSFTSPANFILSLLGQKPGQASGQRRLQKGDIFTKSLGKNVDYIQIGDLYGSRGGTHGGIDIQAPQGTYIALRVDCEVVAHGDYGNYGTLMDVWVPQLGIQLRFAHLSSVIIKSGKISAGTSFARVGSTGNASGPHIHFEYDVQKGATRGGGAGNPEAYVRLLLLTKYPNKDQFSPAPNSVPGKPSTPTTPLTPSSPSTTIQTPEGEIQIESESSNTLDEFLIQITPERKGRKIVFINDVSPAGTKVVMGGGGSQIITSTEFDMVNNFIKNKLLLDLNYL